MTLKVELTKPATEFSQYKLLMIYGGAKTGKSSLANTFPKPLFLDFEDGLTAMSAERVKLSSFEQFRAIVPDLRADRTFHTIVFDTFDYFIALLEQELLMTYKADSLNSGQLSFGKGRNILSAKVRNVITTLRSLPHQIVLLCHSITRTTTSSNGDSRSDVVLALDDKGITSFLTGACDAIFYLSTGTTYKDGKEVRIHKLSTMPDHAFVSSGPRMELTGRPIVAYDEERLHHKMLLADYHAANPKEK